MSHAPARPEVRLLQQQVKSLRSGPAQGSTRDRREEGGAYKIAMLGPLQAGKTKISAQIAGLGFPAKYEPTAGVRILELTELIQTEHGEISQPVELWDCSGDQKYESCWSAICDKLDGAIIAFDPTNKSQANDVRIWCEWFCKRAKLYDGQVVIFAHGELSGNHKPLSVRAGDRTVLVPIVNVSTINLPPAEEDGTQPAGPAKQEFRNFMGGVHAFITGGGATQEDY